MKKVKNNKIKTFILNKKQITDIKNYNNFWLKHIFKMFDELDNGERTENFMMDIDFINGTFKIHCCDEYEEYREWSGYGKTFSEALFDLILKIKKFIDYRFSENGKKKWAKKTLDQKNKHSKMIAKEYIAK